MGRRGTRQGRQLNLDADFWTNDLVFLKIRPLWRHYYQNTQAAMFIIDSNDRDRIPEALEELHRLIGELAYEESDIVVALLCNKQDLVTAMSIEEITERLEIGRLPVPCKVFGCSGKEGWGIREPLDWVDSIIE